MKSAQILLSLWIAAAGSGDLGAEERIPLETGLGAIEMAVDSARAPLTARNFLRYVDAGRYDGAGLRPRAPAP